MKTIIRTTICALLFSSVLAFSQVPANPRDTAMKNGTNGTGSSGVPADTPSNQPAEVSFNKKLAEKLTTLLPLNFDPHVAAKGFVDLKDFVATVRAANNLSIPFGDLKHNMKDGSSGELREAIHKLKPEVDAKAEVKKAQEQARQDIKESK
jgi:hypothetical protein